MFGNFKSKEVKKSSRVEGLSVFYGILTPVSLDKFKDGTPFIKYGICGAEDEESINQPDFMGSYVKNRVVVSDVRPLVLTDKYNNLDILNQFLLQISEATTGSTEMANNLFAKLKEDGVTDPIEGGDIIVDYINEHFAEKPAYWVIGGIMQDDPDGKIYFNSRFTPIKSSYLMVSSSEDKALDSLNKRIENQIEWCTKVHKYRNGDTEMEAFFKEIGIDNPSMSQAMFKDERTDKSKPYNSKLVELGFDESYKDIVFSIQEEEVSDDMPF